MWLAAGVFAGHVVVGVVWALGVFRAVESSLPAAYVYAVAYGALTVFVDQWIGRSLELTWPLFESLVYACVGGAVVGIGLVVVLFKPETESRRVEELERMQEELESWNSTQND